MPNFIPYVVSDNTISVMTKHGMEPVTKEHPNYDKILAALENQDFDQVEALINIPREIERACFGNVKVVNDQVTYNGKPIDGILVDRLLKLLEQGKPIEYLLWFLDNLHQNPTFSARKELPLFMQHNDIPITSDGCFLAFKRVDAELRSIHPSPDGTHLQHVFGEYLSMPREDVNDDRQVTCAEGLHVCSQEYLNGYGGERTIICKVHPRDVVAIPYDYNNKKMRVCGYIPVGEFGVGITHDDMTGLVTTIGGEVRAPDYVPSDFEREVDEDDEEDPANEPGLHLLGDGIYKYVDADYDEHKVVIRGDIFGHQIIEIHAGPGDVRRIDTGHASLDNAMNTAETRCEEMFG